MTDTAPNPETTPPPATMSLADFFTPTLYAGKYTLTATQTLVIDGAEEFKVPAKTFYVAAPRFVLAPDEVYSVYPPDGQTGAYHATVPHVVFRRRGLPWERKPWPDAEDGVPWMAVLVFDESEMSDVTVKSVSFADAVDKTQGGSGIELNDWEKPDPPGAADADKKAAKVCMVVDVPGRKFREIAPRLSELNKLAHARKVETGDKEDVPGIGDGWFSVLVANRTPAPDAHSFIFVVSLEGWKHVLDDGASAPWPTTVRLVVLARWAFGSYGKNFRDLLDALCFEGSRPDPKTPATRDMWLRVLPPAAEKNEAVKTALGLGHVPMRHLLRQGDRAVSWYRGPLSPAPIPSGPNLIFRNADEALQFDTNLGLFNVSYAAAWQLGRLLALQAPEFAGALFNWEGSFIAERMIGEADKMIEKDKLFVQDNAAGTKIDPARADELLEDEMMTAIVLEWCLAPGPWATLGKPT